MTIKIDTTDIKATYGITLGEGSMKEVLQWPSLKSVTTIDYPDEDGTRAELSSPALDTRTMTLHFIALTGANIDGFTTFLKSAIQHTISIDIVDNTPFYSFDFRLVSIKERETIEGCGFVDAEVVDYDSFLAGYSYSTPALSVKSYNYKIDARDISTYGLIPLYGSTDEILKIGETKEPLVIESSRETGATVDTGATVRTKSRDITLELWGHYSRTEFSAYKAALYDLTRPGYRTLTAEGKTISCWYKSQSVQSLWYSDGAIDIVFILNLTTH